MSDDLFESISQGGSEEEVAEHIRIREIADGLRRCCQLYEAQFGIGQETVSLFELEQRSAEIYAKSNNLWISFCDIMSLGVPGPSGNENDLYVLNNTIYKYGRSWVQ